MRLPGRASYTESSSVLVRFTIPHGVLPRIEDYVKLRGLVRAREGGLCFLGASGDFLAKDRLLPELAAGDLLAIRCAGAYGREMASSYNARGRCPEVLIEDGTARLVRTRGALSELWAGETR